MQNFSPASRLWIYQANRPFATHEVSFLNDTLSRFSDEWTAHNAQLHAGFTIRYNQFIFLYVDESQTGASGCSIDKSVRLMKDLEEKLGIELFDRFSMAYKEENGQVRTVGRDEFEQLVLSGKIGAETIVFNNLVQTLAEAEHNWEVPFAKSWHARLFPLPA